MTLLLLSIFTLFAPSSQQSKPDTLSSTIEKVTVYRTGAFITRTSATELEKGTHTLVFRNLSEYLNKETVQLGGKGTYTILSVNQAYNYFTSTVEDEGVETLRARKNSLQSLLERNQAQITVQKKRLEFLDPEKLLNKEMKYSATEISELLDFYSAQSDSIENKLLDFRNLDKQYRTELAKVNGQISQSVRTKKLRTSEIIVELSVDQKQPIDFELTYLISSAGWQPTYDIRADDISKPVELIYKASVYQNSGYDWSDVELTVSSSNPTENGIKPTLSPNFIDFYDWGALQAVSKREVNGAIAKVSEDDFKDVPVQSSQSILQERAAGVQIETQSGTPGGTFTVTVRGAGTINSGDAPLYIVDGIQVSFANQSSREVKFPLESINPTSIESIETLKTAAATSIYGANGANGVVIITTKKGSQFRKKMELLASQQKQVSTFRYQASSFSYTLDSPYSIPSGKGSYTATLTSASVPTSYEYATVPKVAQRAFLISKISDWGKLNLLAGKANLYLQNTFVGSTSIYPSSTDDTLYVSLGIDKSIIVQRDAVTDFEKRKFFGNKTQETKTFEINVRNTKSTLAHIRVEDQIPVSLDEGIKVNAKELAGASYEKETGLLVWELDLKPGETRTIRFTYELEYPKNKRPIES